MGDIADGESSEELHSSGEGMSENKSCDTKTASPVG